MDFDFTVDSIPKEASFIAQRLAVLRPLARDQVGSMMNDSQVVEAVRIVTEVWRKKVSKLCGLGVFPSDRAQFMRNCPPSMIRTENNHSIGKLRPCHAVLICPWCWGRQVVVRVMQTVTNVLDRYHLWFRPGRTEADVPYKLRLMRLSGVDSYPSRPGAVQKIHPLDRFLLLDSQMRDFASFYPDESDIQLATISPGRKGFRWSVRCLSLVPVDQVCLEDALQLVLPKKRELSEFVAKFVRYPSGMTLGSAQHIKEILDVRKGSRHRFLRFNGEFRKNGLGKE